MFRLLLSAGLASTLLAAPAIVNSQAGKAPPSPVLVIDTAKGVIEVGLTPAEAPKKIFSLPRRARACSCFTRASN